MTSKDNGGPASDRELLEMAAKAAGIDSPHWQNVEHPKRSGLYGAFYCSSHYWNPLTDAGDALRLAVKLNMIICVNDAESSAQCCFGSRGYKESCIYKVYGKDAATRRAIVRAAAAIGSAM